MARGKKKSFLICFTGIDGSGKSTVAQMLVEELEQRGIKSKAVWCGWKKFESPLLGPIASVARRLRFRRGKEPSKTTGSTSESGPGLLRRYLILTDYLMSALIRVKIPLMRGQSLVCDRYVYDIMADSLRNHGRLERKLLKMLPKPDMIFLVDLPEEVAFRRKTDVPSVDFLARRRKAYLNLGKEYGMITVDGTCDLPTIRKAVTARTLEHFGEGSPLLTHDTEDSHGKSSCGR